MGEVYAAEDQRLGREVAVKILRRELAADPDTRRRFESEARLAARLVHPNVVAVFDSGESAGVPFLVMERLPGRTLADAVAQGPIDPEEVRIIGAQVLDALAAAHAAGMVHRDVKPGNVLATGTGLWKVADFGIAKSLEVADGDATVTGIVMGTPAYLAPERVAGGAATVATDIYATGVLLYEALSGRRPVEAGASPAALLAPDPTPIEVLCPQVPPDLAQVVGRAMAVDPARRFPDALTMAAALRGHRPAATVAMPTPTRSEPPGEAGEATVWGAPGAGMPTVAGEATAAGDATVAAAGAVPAEGAAATRPLPAGVAAPPVPPAGSPAERDPAAPDDHSRRLFIAGGIGATFVVVIALVVAGLGHHHSPARAPATPTGTSAAPGPTGSLPPSLSSALQHLQQAVQP
jgi:hypothetical protein